MKKFFQEMKIRFQLPSPEFFVELAKFGNWMMGVGLIILTPTIPENLGIEINVHFPPIVTTIAGYMVFGGLLIGRISKLTVKDPSQLPNQEP